MTLAKISGHKDLRLLREHYYHETLGQIAARLWRTDDSPSHVLKLLFLAQKADRSAIDPIRIIAADLWLASTKMLR